MRQMFLPCDCTVMLVDENKNSLGSVNLRADDVRIVDGKIKLPEFNLTTSRAGQPKALVLFYGPMVLVCEIGTGNSGEIKINASRLLPNDSIAFTQLSLAFDSELPIQGSSLAVNKLHATRIADVVLNAQLWADEIMRSFRKAPRMKNPGL